jgi:FtsP/CotA-like multicopper oxidase with cupredoxin domain
VSRAQRLSFLAVAVVIAVVAVVLLTTGGSDDNDDAETTSATATPTATATAAPEETETETPTPTPTATPKPQPTLLQTGKVARLRFEQGDTVRFRVRSDVAEEIHVHGYDVVKAVPAGRTTNVSFPADITGIFEIEFHGSGELIAQLRVDPD